MHVWINIQLHIIISSEFEVRSSLWTTVYIKKHFYLNMRCLLQASPWHECNFVNPCSTTTISWLHAPLGTSWSHIIFGTVLVSLNICYHQVQN